MITLLCFFTYFRPAEPFKLLGRHVIPPAPTAGLGHQFWALTLHPFELGEASKTLEFDESILLDRPESVFLGPLLHGWAVRRGMNVPIFALTQLEYAQCFRASCAALRLDVLGPPTPHQLRHAGASWDFAAGARNLSEIQRRGRWRATASVRRYEKGGRITEQLYKLPPATRTHAIACGVSIVDVVCCRRLPLVGP